MKLKKNKLIMVSRQLVEIHSCLLVSNYASFSCISVPVTSVVTDPKIL